MRYPDAIADHQFDQFGVSESSSAFLRAVYGWMAVGLGLTACTAWYVAGSPTLVAAIAGRGPVFWGLVIAQLAIVFVLASRVDRLGTGAASVLFVVYSVLTGVTLSLLLLVFTGESIAQTFVVAAGTFGALALYGATTRRNLAGTGRFLFMGLVGLVLTSVVGLIWQSDALQFVISVAGVLIFAGLTAVDAQRLTEMSAISATLPGDRTGPQAIAGALALYLDFINLFLSLLRFVGRRRD